jgi:hypothetical protein
MRLVCCLTLLLAACGSNPSEAGANACSTSPAAGQPAFRGGVDFGPLSGNSFDADASFRGNFGGAVQTSGCPGTQVGSCCFVPAGGPSCPFPDESNAGTITIARNGTQIAQLTFDKSYDADTSSTPGLTWQPGDTLSVTAAGSAGGVGAFSGSVVAPAPLSGITPALSGTVAIQKAQDFVIHWTPGSGTATAQLFLSDVRLNGISCTVPVTAGSITVASSLLSLLGGSGSIILSPLNATSVTGANAAVRLEADSTISIASATYQ